MIAIASTLHSTSHDSKDVSSKDFITTGEWGQTGGLEVLENVESVIGPALSEVNYVDKIKALEEVWNDAYTVTFRAVTIWALIEA